MQKHETPRSCRILQSVTLFHSALPPRVSARMVFYKTMKAKLQELCFFAGIMKIRFEK